MNNYIQLQTVTSLGVLLDGDGYPIKLESGEYVLIDEAPANLYRYSIPAGKWQAIQNLPSQISFRVNGKVDMTYGEYTGKEWNGYIEGAVSPAEHYGSIENLKETLYSKDDLIFIDHYGDQYVVCVVGGQFAEISMTNVWDSPSNRIFIQVRLVEKK